MILDFIVSPVNAGSAGFLMLIPVYNSARSFFSACWINSIWLHGSEYLNEGLMQCLGEIDIFTLNRLFYLNFMSKKSTSDSVLLRKSIELFFWICRYKITCCRHSPFRLKKSFNLAWEKPSHYRWEFSGFSITKSAWFFMSIPFLA